MTVRAPATLILAALVAGCAATPTRTAAPVRATPIQSAAAPRSCVQLTSIREARVKDDNTIDFVMRGGEVLRNTLPHSCPQLGFEKAFTYATSLSQLCSVDIITVINQGGGPRLGATCGLGAFTLISAEAAKH